MLLLQLYIMSPSQDPLDCRVDTTETLMIAYIKRIVVLQEVDCFCQE
jgi:hypothetical protein